MLPFNLFNDKFNEKNHFKLNPSKALQNNSDMYNTFHMHIPYTSAMNYLSDICDAYIKNPPDAQTAITNLANLSDTMLVYLAVEIRKMLMENGCFAYEKREPGCLATFFEGLTYALSHANQLEISIDEIKQIHRAITNPKNVQIRQIDELSSGHLRKRDIHIYLSQLNVSIAGIQELLERIQGQDYNSIKLCDVENIQVYANYANNFIDYSFIKLLLNNITKIDNMSDATFINTFHAVLARNTDERFKPNMALSQQSLLEIFESTHFKQLLMGAIYQAGGSFPVQERASRHLEQLANTRDYISILQDPFYQQYHEHIIDKVNCIVEKNFEQAEKIYNNFIINKSNCDKIQDVESKAKEMHQLLSQNDGLYIEFVENSYIEGLLNKIIKDYNQEALSVKQKTLNEKFYFVAKIIQQFLITHPFNDANNRVFANVLTNIILLKLDLPFAVFYNPFVFYAQSVSDIAETLKLSCANYLALQEIAKGTNNIFNLKETYTTQEKQSLAQYTRVLREYIANLNQAKPQLN